MSFSNPVVGGEGGELIREAIRSRNFETLVAGWIIRRDGSAEFHNVIIRIDLEVGDSIIVGPDGSPQVVIGTTTDGLDRGYIRFPTNDPNETEAAEISSSTLGIGDAQRLLVQFRSGEMEESEDQSGLTLRSGSVDGTVGASASLSTLSANIDISDAEILLDGAPVVMAQELTVATDNADTTNNPVRVISGRVNAGTNTVTLVAGDSEITNTGATNTYLENGVAYTVDIQIQTRQSVGTSAAGTQRFDWKIWDGAVGGTQLANTVETYNGSVGNILNTVQLSWIFEFTGTTGSRTLRLSCADGAGADTLQVQSNTRYFMIVKRIGDPARILNL